MLIVLILTVLAWPSEAQAPPPSPSPAAEEPALPPEAPPVEEPLPPGTPIEPARIEEPSDVRADLPRVRG